MGKIVRTVVLAAAMAALATAGGLGTAPAQVKDKGKSPKAEKAGTVEIYEAKDGYRFKVVDADGKTVAMSTKGYDKAEDVRKVLEFVKHTLNTAKVTEVKGERKK